MATVTDPGASVALVGARQDRQERRIEPLETAARSAAARDARIAVLEVQVADLQRQVDRAWLFAQIVTLAALVVTASVVIKLALR